MEFERHIYRPGPRNAYESDEDFYAALDNYRVAVMHETGKDANWLHESKEGEVEKALAKVGIDLVSFEDLPA